MKILQEEEMLNVLRVFLAKKSRYSPQPMNLTQKFKHPRR